MDARDGVFFVYSLLLETAEESALLRRCRDKRVSLYQEEAYAPPAPLSAVPALSPVVVGIANIGAAAPAVTAPARAP